MPEKPSLEASEETPKPAPKEESPEKAPEAKAEKGKEEGKKGKDGEFAPDPEHPRYKEVYWRMKKAEREAEERGKDLEAVRAHQAKLDAALADLDKRTQAKDDIPEPDIITDPEGYKAWIKLKDAKKERDFEQKRAADRLKLLIDIEEGLHDDYSKVVALAERDMERDPALKKKVWDSTNPAREAYKLGRKLMDEIAAKDKEEVERQTDLARTSLESDSPAPDKPAEEVLTDDEKRVVRNLFRNVPYDEAVKKYKAQKKALGMAKGN